MLRKLVIGSMLIIWSCSGPEEEINCSSLSLNLKDKEDPTICSPPNGSVTLGVQGGEIPYAFRLNDGPFQPDSLFSGLQGGNYLAEVMDANGCLGSISIALSSFATDLTAEFATMPDTDCLGENGQVSFTASGGVPPYQLKFQNTTIGGPLTLNGLSQGTYQASVVDTQLCEFVMAFTIVKGNSDISWALDIKPIIDMRCAKPLCHVAGTGRSDLSKLQNVQQLALQIKTRTQNGSMPFDESMPVNEIQLIACWVDDGALNN